MPRNTVAAALAVLLGAGSIVALPALAPAAADDTSAYGVGVWTAPHDLGFDPFKYGGEETLGFRVTPATWQEGDTVTVTATVLFPPAGTCTFPGGLTRSYGTSLVRINFPGMEIVSTSSPATIAASRAEFRPEPGSRYGVGQSFTVTYIADEQPMTESWPSAIMSGTASYNSPSDFAYNPQTQLCPYAVRGESSLGWRDLDIAVNEEPVAAFAATPAVGVPLGIDFENQSTDPDGDAEELDSFWSFGDGETSSETSPTHVYDEAGTYTVALEVTDPDGLMGQVSHQVVVGVDGLVVNSTGDAPATDAAAGCDTGGTVGGEPECTLRAALQVANLEGLGAVTFDIAGTGIPTIALASPLPALTGEISVDGSTQSAGRVAIAGDSPTAILSASEGTLRLTALTVSGTPPLGIALDGGGDHELTDVYVGTAGDGSANVEGVVAGIRTGDDTTGTTIDGAVVSTPTGIIGRGPTTVTDSSVGVAPNGTPFAPAPQAGIALLAPGAVSGTTVSASTVGLVTFGPGAAGSTFTGNSIGVSGATALEAPGYGIRIEGTPQVTVSDNDVIGAYGIVVTGSYQFEQESQQLEFESPEFGAVDADPLSVAGTTVVGNRLGMLGQTASAETTRTGLVAWAQASGVRFEDNVVVGHSTGIDFLGGSEHVAVGNTIGFLADRTTRLPVEDGVYAEGDDLRIGGAGEDANYFAVTETGIELIGDGGVIEGNALVGSGTETRATDGVLVDGDRARVASNSVAGFDTGISVTAESGDAVITRNIVLSGGTGIRTSSDDAEIDRNLVGITPANEVLGNETGIAVTDGAAVVSDNFVAGSQTGIDVAPGAKATIRGTTTTATTGKPIAAPSAPGEPSVTGAIRTGAEGEERTLLVVRDLPPTVTGTIEVFGSTSCTDPEPELALGEERIVDGETTYRLVQLSGDPEVVAFVVLFTDAEGSTSEVSTCAQAGIYPDGDGDGSPDPVDALVAGESDPARAGLVTDEEELLMLGTIDEGHRFRNVAIVPDPAPGSHPAGFELSYGAISWELELPEPGGTARVFVQSWDGMTAGSSYWKHAPQTSGGPASWFEFTLAADGSSGAFLFDSPFSGGATFGTPKAWALVVPDGGRGDADGFTDGIVSDPGGPANVAATEPTTPPVAAPPAQPLASTGSDPSGALLLGLVLLLVGAVVVVRRRVVRG